MPREGEDRENWSEGQGRQHSTPVTQVSQLDKHLTETCYVPDTALDAGGSNWQELQNCCKEQGLSASAPARGQGQGQGQGFPGSPHQNWALKDE